MFTTDVYVQIFENLVRAKNVRTGRTTEMRPQEPFTHPRALVGSFTQADACVRKAVAEVRGLDIRRLRILMHPMSQFEGGLTEIESRLYYEFAVAARARKVHMWVGHPLSDEEVLSRLSES